MYTTYTYSNAVPSGMCVNLFPSVNFRMILDIINLVILLSVLLERLLLGHKAVNPVIWTLVTCTSSFTSYIYVMLLVETLAVIKRNTSPLKAVISLFLFLAGMLSTITLLDLILQAHTVVMEIDLDSVQQLLFYFAGTARLVHSIMGVTFFSLAAPLTTRWAAAGVTPELKDRLNSLLPSKVLLFLHWTILIPTFLNKADSLSWFVHAASSVYRVVGLVWIMYFCYVCYMQCARKIEEVMPDPHESRWCTEPFMAEDRSGNTKLCVANNAAHLSCRKHNNNPINHGLEDNPSHSLVTNPIKHFYDLRELF